MLKQWFNFDNKFTLSIFLVNMDDSLADKIAQSCIDLYMELPKTGKPVEHEWTILSCVVQYEIERGSHRVVSLGTGTKCVGATRMSGAGNVLNDSHAEVIARRCFLVYLYQNIENLLSNRDSIFILEDNRFKLRPGIEFILYSSQLPCGDVSIIPKTIDDEYGDPIKSKKRLADDSVCDLENKKLKIGVADDVHRTGAKCLPTAEQDPKKPGINYHVVGQVRTKPGRGDVTLSVSCSDKLARWIRVGVQGALLDMLLAEPIYIKHFIFGANSPYSIEALERGLLTRNRSYTLPETVPSFQQCSVVFPSIKNESNTRPAAASTVWVRINDTGISETATRGMKLGLIKKMYNRVSAYLSISKYKLYERFINILKMNNELKMSICGDCMLDMIPYNEMKNKSMKYQMKWKDVKENFFKLWTEKPDLWNFCIKSV